MNKIALTLLLFFVVLTSKAQLAAEKQVLMAVEQLKVAMVNADRETLNNLASSSLSYGHSSGKVEDRAAFVETIASGKSDFLNIELKNQTVKVSGKTAIVRHQLHAITNDGGKPGEVNLSVLLVWQKQSGKWLLLARQAFKLP